MPRSLSSVAKRAMFAQATGEVFVLLLTIDHPTLIAPIRVVNDTQNLTSNGKVFVAFPFAIILPDEQEEQPPRMRLVIDNVDRSIVIALRNLISSPTIQLDVCLASQPNIIEASFPGFTFREANYDQLVVEGDLALEDVVLEAFPEGSFEPHSFPGIYGA